MFSILCTIFVKYHFSVLKDAADIPDLSDVIKMELLITDGETYDRQPNYLLPC